MTSRILTAIDLFCGAGGLSDGFRQAGFHVLAGQDYDERAGATFAATHPEATFVGGPIQNVTPEMLLKAAGKKQGQIDVIVGGPPCQGYSGLKPSTRRGRPPSRPVPRISSHRQRYPAALVGDGECDRHHLDCWREYRTGNF